MKIGRTTFTWVALFAVVASSCASTNEFDADQARITTTVQDVDSTSITTFGGREQEWPDPRTVEVLYDCKGVPLSLTELAGLADLPRPSEQQFEKMTEWDYLGDADQWALTENGFAVNVNPLDSTPAAFIHAAFTGESADPHYCVPVTSGNNRGTVRWRAESVTGSTATISIENCVDASEAIADVRLANGNLVAWVYGWRDHETDCAVDGSNTILAELPERAIGPLLSGHTWPPVEADPANWYSPGFIPTVNATVDELANITCEAISELHGVSVWWYNVPAGLTGEILADGALESSFISENHGEITEAQVLFGERMVEFGNPAEDWEITAEALEEARQPKGVLSLFGGDQPSRRYELRFSRDADGDGDGDGDGYFVDCGEAGTLAELPVPECTLTLVSGMPSLVFTDRSSIYSPGTIFFRDGEPIVLSQPFGGPLDTTAVPGTTYSYGVEIPDTLGGRPSVTADCGSITALGPADQREEIEWAKALFNRIGLGPYIYMTVRTEGVEQELFMEYTRSDTHEFAPTNPDAEVVNPLTIHDRLLLALEAGAELTYELNAASGLPTSWSIDGVDHGFVCVEFDSSDPKSRKPGCDPERNMIR